MIGTSRAFQDQVRRPHEHVARVDVVRDRAVVRTLPVHSGSVTADRSGRILRRFDCSVADPDGQLTPAGIRDLLVPFGTELRLFRGVRIPTIVTASDVDYTAATWSTGTRVNVVGDVSGDLILGGT